VIIQILDAITQAAVKVFVEVNVVRGLAIQDAKTLLRIEHNLSSFTGNLDALLGSGTRFWLEMSPAEVQV
jgi:hypothetical protein